MTFGDAEAAAAAILRAALTGATVATDLIGFHAGLPWVRVNRVGGVPTLWMALDNAKVSVEAFGPDKGAALDLACAARDAIFTARGLYTGHGLTLYDVTDLDGLTWLPDEVSDPPAPRYTFTLALVTRPA